MDDGTIQLKAESFLVPPLILGGCLCGWLRLRVKPLLMQLEQTPHHLGMVLRQVLFLRWIQRKVERNNFLSSALSLPPAVSRALPMSFQSPCRTAHCAFCLPPTCQCRTLCGGGAVAECSTGTRLLPSMSGSSSFAPQSSAIVGIQSQACTI